MIGSPAEDVAINVDFDDLGKSFWFAEEVIEIVDHGAGTVLSLDGRDVEWVRLPDKDWE